MGSIPGQGFHMLHSMAKSQTNKRLKTSQMSKERQITLENLRTAIWSGQIGGSQRGATMGAPHPATRGPERHLACLVVMTAGGCCLQLAGGDQGDRSASQDTQRSTENALAPNAWSAQAGSAWLDGHVIKVRTEPKRMDSPALAASHPGHAPRPPRSDSLLALSDFALGTSAKRVYNISPPQ